MLSLMEEVHLKQEIRNKFDIYSEQAINSELPGISLKAKIDFNNDKNYDTDEFKKFLLACIWEKRIPKNDILMMNLVQNILTLKEAVDDG